MATRWGRKGSSMHPSNRAEKKGRTLDGALHGFLFGQKKKKKEGTFSGKPLSLRPESGPAIQRKRREGALRKRQLNLSKKEKKSFPFLVPGKKGRGEEGGRPVNRKKDEPASLPCCPTREL